MTYKLQKLDQPTRTAVAVGIFLFFLNMFPGLPDRVNARTCSPDAISASVFDLLQAARVAQDAGQTERAQHYWLRAKRLNPSLNKPGWLLPETSTGFSVAVPERQLLLDQSSQLPDSLRKPKLEALLRVNPLDKDVRHALLRLALRQGDKVAEQRHQSVLNPLLDSASAPFWKLALLALIAGAILWFTFAPLPGEKTFTQPEGKTLFENFLLTVRSFINKK